MAEKRWTESQHNAINSRKGSILVSAAAGSGKTAVLVERVIKRIIDEENPTDVDKLLVVTYTRAAAAEMKERISKKLSELLKDDPFNKHLRRQQLLLPQANISTIHSFCSTIVKNNFFSCNVSPNFRLADENELGILQEEAINTVLNELYNEKSEEFLSFAGAFSTAKSDSNLIDTVFGLYNFLCAHPFSEKWLNEKEQMYDFACDVIATPWGEVLYGYASDVVDFCEGLIDSSLALWNELPELGDNLFDILKNDLVYIQDLKEVLNDKNWDAIREKLLSADFSQRFPTIKGMTDNPTKLQIQGNRKLLKTSIEKLIKLFAKSAQTCRDEIYSLSPIVHQLFKTVRLFGKEYSRLKNDRNWLDFNDLEHHTLSVLVKETDNGFEFTRAAREIAENYEEVMVDEYQDANEVQDLIFRAVTNDNQNLFVVGDVKQSVYRFRQAMPEIFIRRKESYSIYDSTLDNYPSKIILDKNFRSRSGVTDSVNFVFKRLLSKKVGDMEYTSEERLVPGAAYPESNTPDTSFYLIKTDDADVQEAKEIAKIIKENVGKYMVTQGDTKRPLKYSDCAILLRKANAHAGNFVQELKSQNIPTVSDVGDGFLNAQEIAVILSLLKVIDNPLQDIPLLTVLMSPLYGFSADDMAEIRSNHISGSLYSALKYSEENGSNRIKAFFNDLSDYSFFAASNTLEKLLNNIYTKTGYENIIWTGEGGATAVNNLRLLREYAKSFEANGYKGLTNFIRFITRIEERGSDLAGAPSRDSNVDAVVVMSIHRSKGLEFPFCFVAGLSGKFKTDSLTDVLLHSELGLGIRRKDAKNFVRTNTMPRNAVELELDRESKSEEVRILYVAMTRAREKLYMLASVKNVEKHLQTVASSITNKNKLSPYIIRSSTNMASWVTACALLHPSGDILRSASGLDVDFVCNVNSKWDIKIIDSTEDENQNENENAEEVIEECKSGGSQFENLKPCINHKNEQESVLDIKELEKAFNWEYNYKSSSEMPVKISVSEIAHENNNEDTVILSHPSFLLREDLTPAQKGTAMHNYMQYANYERALKNPKQELIHLLEKGFISEAESKVINIDKITICLNHPVMQRFLNSEKTFREYRFTINVNAQNLHSEMFKNSQDNIILQGAVDCAFVEDNEIVIVDYKTDKVKQIEELASRYSKQLELYKMAMEESTGLKVKECIIFSLDKGDIIQLPLK